MFDKCAIFRSINQLCKLLRPKAHMKITVNVALLI